MRMLHQLILSIGIFVVISSCATVTFPVRTYKIDCSRPMMEPSEPGCLYDAKYFGGFQSNGQFNACRQEVQNYQDAMSQWAECVDNYNVNELNRYIDESKATLECLMKNLKNCGATGCSSLPQCSEVKDIDMIEPPYSSNYIFSPSCIRSNELFPQSVLSCNICIIDIKRYIEDSKSRLEYNRIYFENETQRDIQKAVDQFNCLAKGEGYCP